jgi:hypothetical protein
MILDQRGHNYPSQTFHVIEFPADLSSLFPKPVGLVEDCWPPLQLTYLGSYLSQLNCKSLVVEGHYIDRDYTDDLALFYSRSLRAYPNYCYRLHFFAEGIDQARFRSLVTETDLGKREQTRDLLQKSYLGFSVVRPLVGAPLGRTVLRTFPEKTVAGERRLFGGVRHYPVHLAGFALGISGLAFQQQDQGVSACATTALWSALHKVAPLEGLAVPTPADITEAASRYVLEDGRSLPSAGLSIYQICEATRAAGLAPLLIQSVTLEHDRAQILAYAASGFPPVLALQPLAGGDGHAVCAVGVKLGDIAPGTDPNLNYRDAASAVRGVYLHDDRLGPYASASLDSYTMPPSAPNAGEIRTRFTIRWSGEQIEFSEAILKAIIVPVPPKLRLTVARMRGLAAAVAQGCAQLLPRYKDLVTMNCFYQRGTAYREGAYMYGLSEEGLYALLCDTALSRFVGVIEIGSPDGPLMDLLIDATETQANPSVLACVKRDTWPAAALNKIQLLAKNLGAACIA